MHGVAFEIIDHGKASNLQNGKDLRDRELVSFGQGSSLFSLYPVDQRERVLVKEIRPLLRTRKSGPEVVG